MLKFYLMSKNLEKIKKSLKDYKKKSVDPDFLF